MLQSMREGAKGTTAKVIIGFIVLSFAGFGLQSLLPGGSGTSVAEVNGTEITPQELQLAVDNQKRQLMQILGDNIDPAMLEDDRLRPGALESLIERELLLQAAGEQGLVASDRAIGGVVASIEAFQIDGQFNPDQYKLVLANAGLTPERFRRAQAQDIVLNQLQEGVSGTDFTTSLELAAAADVTAEERDVRYLLINAEALLDASSVDDAQVQAYYDANPDEFVSEEQVVAEYIELAAEDFYAPVDEGVLEDQFETVKEEYTVVDQTRVSHILLIQSGDESAEDYARRIDDVAARLADGEDFAQVAMTASDDIGSADMGGELGFTDGTAFPDAMEEAIAALEVNQISSPVETDAGTHFIRVEERAAGEAPDYDSLRAELEASIQQSNAEQELLGAVDALRDLSFNSPDLAGPAEALGVEAAISAPVGRNQGEGVFETPKARELLFSDEVYTAGNNSDVIELQGGRFLAVRIAEKIPPAPLPFDTVADRVRAQLESKALESALSDVLADVQARRADGESMESIAAALGWEWRVELGARRQGSLLPREVSQLAFSMELTSDVDLEIASLPADQYAIVELDRVVPGSVDNLSPVEAEGLSNQLTTVQGQVSVLEYRNALRNNAEIVTR